MKTARKRRTPANDYRPTSVKKTPNVVYKPSKWNGKRISAATIVAVFVFSSGFFGAMIQMPALDEIAALAGIQSEPFDIVLGTNAPALQFDREESSVVPIQQNALPPVLDVTVEDGAGDYNATAQALMRQGDIKQAIEYQRLAVESRPFNMRYRLELAIMHDRLSDSVGASLLYKQVLQAYDNHDKTLPKKLDIESIRRRLAYLDPTAIQ
ncbi:MAG: hypothetical protein WC464_06375 [Bdellovibrionales bacterium]